MDGAALLVRQAQGVVLPVQGCCRAHLDAAHAAGAQLLSHNRIGGKLGCGEYGAEAHSRAILWRQKHIVGPEISQPRQICGMAVGEEGHRIF